MRPHAGKEIHIVLDNLSTHTNPHVHFHFTPVGSSWLDQIEIWFGITTRLETIAADVFVNGDLLTRLSVPAPTQTIELTSAGGLPLADRFGDLFGVGGRRRRTRSHR
ncbi:hypothetical protein [Streptomyces sp. NPDC094472]|uniref:hypothetical protein n=1 Tax=Streptomyces sp. NPDC094472 TaxID=3155080 RepID=UPI0033205DCA